MNAQHDGITEAVVGLATEHDPAQLEVILESLSNVQLRSLAASLATQIARDQEPGHTPPATPSVTPTAQDISSPAHLCNVAIEAAARTFGTTPEAVLSPARAQEVADARAVAMTAARTNGLSLPQIAEQFGKDHSSVIHAIRRTGDRPRLAAAASAIAEDITSRCRQVTEARPALRLIRDPEATTAAQAHPEGPDPERLRGPDRTRMVADARAVAMTAARIKGLSLPKIAAEFDDRHHTVVLHSTRRVEKTRPCASWKSRSPRTSRRPRPPTPAAMYDMRSCLTSKSPPHRPAANKPTEPSRERLPSPSPRSHHHGADHRPPSGQRNGH
jgi:hypothetical protein